MGERGGGGEVVSREGPGSEAAGAQFTTQFTCFTSTKVQILGGEVVAREGPGSEAAGAQFTAQFTCFTSTKVASRRSRRTWQRSCRCSVYLFYSYKSTKADTCGAERQEFKERAAEVQALREDVSRVQVTSEKVQILTNLLVQKCKY